MMKDTLDDENDIDNNNNDPKNTNSIMNFFKY